MSTETLNLGDIPDLSGVAEDTAPEPFVDGWYTGTILEQRSFTDSNGNDRTFASGDVPSQNGDSRNIKLQVVLKRADGRTLNVSTVVNYRAEDLTPETIKAVLAEKERTKETGEKFGSLFRAFMTLTRLGKLQKIAGVRQFQRNGNGGLDLHPIYGKTGYFRIGEDSRNPKYKEIKDFSSEAPKRAKVL